MSSDVSVGAHDILLEWASEMSAGSWSQWREACQELDLEPTESAQNLGALGHVEVDWSADRFSCPPPTAAFLHGASGCVIFTGARPRGFLKALNELAESEQDIGFYVHAPAAQRGGPLTVLIEVDLEDAAALCEHANLQWVFDPAWRVAELLPQATLESVAFPEDWPPREDTPRRKFNARELRFEADGHSRGLWHYDGYRRQEAWLNDGERWWTFPTREYAPYLAHPNVEFLTHYYKDSRLTVPAVTPLPPLQARAATLASGRLPLQERHQGVRALAYVNVSLGLASRIAHSLSTELKES